MFLSCPRWSFSSSPNFNLYSQMGTGEYARPRNKTREITLNADNLWTKRTTDAAQIINETILEDQTGELMPFHCDKWQPNAYPKRRSNCKNNWTLKSIYSLPLSLRRTTWFFFGFFSMSTQDFLHPLRGTFPIMGVGLSNQFRLQSAWGRRHYII